MGAKESSQRRPATPQVYVKGVGPGRMVGETGSDRCEVEHRNQGVQVQHGLQDVMSPTRRLDYLRPAANHPSRQVRSASAIFSLLSTMVGGGVLSIPYAFRESGLILAVVFTTLSALASGFTIDLLIGASRSSGADSYELVAKRAFGRKGRLIAMCLLVGLIWLCQIGYLVLLADLLVPVLAALPGPIHLGTGGIRYLVICGAVLLISPLCFQTKLSALRFISVFSFLSLMIVVAALGKHAVESWGIEHHAHVLFESHEVPVLVGAHSISLWPRGWNEVFYVFPIFGLAFLCHFNALPLHAEMHNPSRGRAKRVVNVAMFVCNILYILAGVAGYAFSGPFTCGNILLNFSADDLWINVARVALSFTLTGTFPLFILPCRANLHQLLHFGSTMSPEPNLATECGVSLHEDTPVEQGRAEDDHISMIHVYDRRTGSNLIEIGQFVPKDEAGEAIAWTRCSYVAETVGLILSSVIVACVLESVMVVWTVAGATVAFTIAFTLPISIWLKLHRDLASKKKEYIAWALLVLCILLTIACTYEVVKFLDHPVCPSP